MADIDERAFIENLKRRRELLGMTQTDVAKQMKVRGFGFHQQTVQRIEMGERPVRLAEAFELAEIVSSSVDDMVVSLTGSSERVRVTLEALRRRTANDREVILELFEEWCEPASDLFDALADRMADLIAAKQSTELDILEAWAIKAHGVWNKYILLIAAMHGLVGSPEEEAEHSLAVKLDFMPDEIAAMIDRAYGDGGDGSAATRLAERSAFELAEELNRVLRKDGKRGERQAEA